MAFLAPYMLWGAAAAGIPIALHFFFRSRYRKVPWAAMKFLLTSIEETSRRLKFQELLLLLARVAMLALLALALMRPTSSAGPGAGAAEAVDAVFVIDTSYSMDAREGVTTRLEQAKNAARELIEHLPPHSTVQVVTSADRASLLGPYAPSDLDQARQLIDAIEVSHLATDFLPGVREAAAALGRGHSPNKELYLFSDMQKLGWEQQPEAMTKKLQDVHNQAAVYLIRCGSRTPRNVAVVGIVPQSGIPHTGERAGFAVLVRNSGSEAVRNLTVSLAVDGKAQEKESQPIAELGPGKTQAVALTARLDRPGLRILSAAIKKGSDELEADNRFDQVIHVRDQVRILVVDGAVNEQEPEKSPSFYLMHSMLPVKEADKGGYHVQPRLVTPRLAEPGLLADKDLCVLVNVGLQADEQDRTARLSQEFLDGLGTFVRRGHGLVVFGGDRVSAGLYNRFLYQQQGLLPLKLSAKVAVHDDKPLHLDRDSAASQFFAVFREDENYKGLNGIEIRRHLSVEEPLRTDRKAAPADVARVLLRYSDGRPAVVSRRVEAGEVLLVTTSADLTWSDWPLWRGMYLPFVDLSLNHLLHRQTEQHNQTAGESLRWHAPDRDAGRTFVCIRPDGNRVRLGTPEMVEGRPVATVVETYRAGVYRIAYADGAAVRKGQRQAPSHGVDSPDADGVPFAVVPDLRESENLETLTDRQIDQRLGFKPIHLDAGGDTGASAGTERLSREWTLWVLAAVLGVALVETGLAWLCGRAW